jgi:hypothetical protein
MATLGSGLAYVLPWRDGVLWSVVPARVRDAWQGWELRVAAPAAPPVPERRCAPGRGCDADLARAVAQRLDAVAALKEAGVFVRAVYDGLVTLGGTVDDPAADLAAFEAALDVPGVRRVVSEIAVRARDVVARRAALRRAAA